MKKYSIYNGLERVLVEQKPVYYSRNLFLMVSYIEDRFLAKQKPF